MPLKNTQFHKWTKNNLLRPVWMFFLKKIFNPLSGPFKRYTYTKITTIDTTVIVTSYGRSGSTMLFRSLVQSATREIPRWITKGAKGKGRDLDKIDFKPGSIHTTHHYPPHNIPPANARVIYVFADPIESILSVLQLVHTGKWGRDMFQRHCKNLQTSCENVDDLIYADKLNLERHFDAWMAEDRFPIAFVKYEHLWEHAENISSFVGFHVSLPTRKRRERKKIDTETLRAIEQTYASLRKKVEACEAFFIKNAVSASESNSGVNLSPR